MSTTQFVILRRKSIYTPDGFKALPKRGGMPGYPIYSWNTQEEAQHYLKHGIPMKDIGDSTVAPLIIINPDHPRSKQCHH